MVVRTLSVAVALAACSGCAGCAGAAATPPETAARPGDAPRGGDDGDEGSSEGEGDGDEPSPPPVGSASTGGLYREVERELALMRSSRYSHRTDVDETAGRFDYDCSGFVSYAVARAAPASYRALRAFAGRRPLAKHYVAFLLSVGGRPREGWARVPGAASLAAGDVIAWLKPADSSSSNRSTGHVMVVAGPPRQRSPGEWVVPIADSTAAAHGKADARRTTRSTGLGLGSVVLVADASGAPTAYRWSEAGASPAHATQIVLARVASP
jgi:hypothetical protein